MAVGVGISVGVAGRSVAVGAGVSVGVGVGFSALHAAVSSAMMIRVNACFFIFAFSRANLAKVKKPLQGSGLPGGHTVGGVIFGQSPLVAAIGVHDIEFLGAVTLGDKSDPPVTGLRRRRHS